MKTHTILQVVHGYSAPFLELTRHYNELVRSRGHRVVTLFLRGPANAEVSSRASSDLVLFWDLGSAELQGLKLNLIARMRDVLRREQIDLVVAQRYKPFYLALCASMGLGRMPVVGVAHAFGMLTHRTRRVFLRSMGERWRMLGVSDAITAELASSMPERAHHFHTLHNCLGVEELLRSQVPRDAARERLGIGDHYVFGNVGRLHPDKDQATLLRAFARAEPQLPGAILLLLGEGRCESMYKALARQLGIADKVRFEGFVPDAPTLFSAFDTYVSSSVREAFGMVLAEAMAARLPIISSDCGGAPEVVGDSGWFFPAGDIEQLSQHMIVLGRMSAPQRQAAGERLYRHLEKAFSPEAFRRKALQLPAWPDWF